MSRSGAFLGELIGLGPRGFRITGAIVGTGGDGLDGFGGASGKSGHPVIPPYPAPAECLAGRIGAGGEAGTAVADVADIADIDMDMAGPPAVVVNDGTLVFAGSGFRGIRLALLTLSSLDLGVAASRMGAGGISREKLSTWT